MDEAAHYSAIEHLRDRIQLEIRALRPDDRDGLLAAFDQSSAQSVHRRFFSAKRAFTDREIDYFTKVDFVNHVALVAVVAEEGKPTIVAGARYVVVKPGQAEVAFAVMDQYQGRGIGTLLMRHLVGLARAAGIQELVAEVLADNVRMLKVFAKSGLQPRTSRAHDIIHAVLPLS